MTCRPNFRQSQRNHFDTRRYCTHLGDWNYDSCKTYSSPLEGGTTKIVSNPSLLSFSAIVLIALRIALQRTQRTASAPRNAHNKEVNRSDNVLDCSYRRCTSSLSCCHISRTTPSNLCSWTIRENVLQLDSWWKNQPSIRQKNTSRDTNLETFPYYRC